MQKRLTEKLALLDAFLSKGKISQEQYEEQVQTLLEQSPSQNIGSWKLIQKISSGIFEARHRNRDLSRLQGRRWLFMKKQPSREQTRQMAFFTHFKNPHLLHFESYEIFGDFHLCSCPPFSTSSILIPQQGLRLEVIQPWLEQLASLFDELRDQNLPIGWLRLKDLSLSKSGEIFLTDLCREREATALQQHLLHTGVKQELIVWVELALALLKSDSQSTNSEGEIGNIEDLIAGLTSGDGAGTISDCLSSCMSLLEGLQSNRQKSGITFDEPEGTQMKLEIGKLHPVSLSFVFLRPKNGEPFWMSTQLISQDIFSLFLEEHVCRNVGKKRPVDSLNRDQSLVFCNQLSKKWKLESLYVLRKKRNQRRGGMGVALPSLEQWRYACHKGKSQVGWHNDNSNRQSHDVSSSQANRFQIYDLLGNLWEWLEDGLETQNGLVAGGSWRSFSDDLEHNPIKKISLEGADDVGFRIIITS
jgi:hypothetical protein